MKQKIWVRKTLFILMQISDVSVHNIFTFSRFDHETSTYYFSLILKPSNKIIDNDISR